MKYIIDLFSPIINKANSGEFVSLFGNKSKIVNYKYPVSVHLLFHLICINKSTHVTFLYEFTQFFLETKKRRPYHTIKVVSI